jgi:transcriptional regulator with XRE-family HTH domain
MATRTRGIVKSVHSEGQKAFRELMTKARNDADLTQHDVARRLKTHQSFVAKYEGGERRIDVTEFVTIARAVGADPVRLLKALMQRMA